MIGRRGALLAGGVAVLGIAAVLGGESPAAAACRIGLGLLVLWWAQVVYGPGAALGAVVLAACSLPPLAGAEQIAWAVHVIAQLATAHALMRCLLDPTLQWVGGTAVGLLAALLSGAVVRDGATPAAALAVFSALVALARVVTAERHESATRVAQASAVALALAWGAAMAVLAVIEPLGSSASLEEYAAAGAVAWPGAATGGAAVLRWLAVPLALTLLRPWRSERRYADLVLVAALACLAIPGWRAADAGGQPFAGLGAVVALLALLGAAAWGAGASSHRRRLATAALVVQAAWLIVFPAAPLPSNGGPAPVTAAVDRGRP